MKHRFGRAAVCLGAAAGAIVILIGGRHVANVRKAEDEAAVSDGISYIEALEAKDPAEVKTALTQMEKDKRTADIDQRIADLDNGTTDVWTCFSDAVILGDSRGADFYYDGFLPEDRVLCKIGETVTHAEDHLQAAQAVNPSVIFFTYGFNDADGCWNTAEDYVNAYMKEIGIYRDSFPDAEIFVCTIIPVTDAALEKDQNLTVIPAYNEGLTAACESSGIPVLDSSALADLGLYDTDGIHFLSDFYPEWAKLLIRGEYEYERSAARAAVDSENADRDL